MGRSANQREDRMLRMCCRRTRLVTTLRSVTEPAYRLRAATAWGVLLGGALVVPTYIVMLLSGAAAGGALPAGETVALLAPRVVVLKAARTLHLFDGERLVRSYPIDLGSAPVGPKHRRDDGRTPIGTFHVVTKNADSPYRLFIGLDYPHLAATKRGLSLGLISPGEAASIQRALAAGRRPSWDTALGGGIGIHGHRISAGRSPRRDWTGGCIALSDDHVEELFAVMRIGDPVEILP